MTSEKLRRAREYEAQYSPHVREEDRPAFHLTGGIGWINDPNGFSIYKNEYHLFFQYHPYSIAWGPMHWGHAKTKDFIRWEQLPAALAPDTDADSLGCFSGSAVETPDGKHLLIYTGVRTNPSSDVLAPALQGQCIAEGDGINYEKSPMNPVITGDALPAGCSEIDFRDPKIWMEDGKYYIVVGARMADESGAILLYESEDAVHWVYDATLYSSKNQYGKMWECPDFFRLDNEYVLLVSAQEMKPIGLEFHAGYCTAAVIGHYDGKMKSFYSKAIHSIDYGLDFYAPQTVLTPDGRRIMIAWMQNWTTSVCKERDKLIFGQMTLPREITLKDHHLIQNPVRELEQYRTGELFYTNVYVSGETILPNLRGRCLDMTLSVRPAGTQLFHSFTVYVAKDSEHETSIRFKPSNNTIRIDRSKCGYPYDIVNVRDFLVREHGGAIKFRIILDKNSLELFVNDGEQCATSLIYTDAGADGISFFAEGEVFVDVEKYDLSVPH